MGGVNEGEKKVIFDELKFIEGILLVKYLGVFFFLKKLFVVYCKLFVDMMIVRINNWIIIFMLYVGRLWLVRVVLLGM